jgi:hypothetical protein
LGWNDAKVKIGDDGFGDFVCGQCSVSIFANEAAEGRDLFGKRYIPLVNKLTQRSKDKFKIEID